MENLNRFLFWFLKSLSEVAEFGLKALIIVISFALCLLILKKTQSADKSDKKS